MVLREIKMMGTRGLRRKMFSCYRVRGCSFFPVFHRNTNAVGKQEGGRKEEQMGTTIFCPYKPLMVVPGQQAPTRPCTQHNSALVVYITCMNCLLAVLATGSLETWRFTYMEMVKTSERRQLRDLGCERGKKPKQLVSGLTMKRNKPGRDCLILCHGQHI